MSVNIFKDELQHAQLFGKPVLTTNWLIPRETVPDGWFCYDMRGTDSDPGAHAALVDYTSYDHSGTVLSPKPLKRPATKARRIGKGDYFLHGETMDLETFCGEYGLDVPDNPIKFEMRPASPDEAGLFYTLPPERDAIGAPTANQRSVCGGERRKERNRAEFSPSGGNGAGGVSSDEGTVGHVQIDFGRDGDEFRHTWWPRGPEADSVYDLTFALSREVREYTEAMASAPPLVAEGLHEGFRLLADFNGIVLAGQELEGNRGYKFATWRRSSDHTAVASGNYFDGGHYYETAKLDFACRAGLVQESRQFTDDQLVELYRCARETLEGKYSMTRERRELLEQAAVQIEDSVENLDERVSQSNQRELEEAEGQADGGAEMELSP